MQPASAHDAAATDCPIRTSSAPSDSEAREDIEQIGRAAERGTGLTRQLPAFAKRRTGETQVLDVGEVIAGMQTLLDPLRQSAGSLGTAHVSPRPCHALPSLPVNEPR
jgi:C4-dicarboxylate-specific signal transduction histidine kinase